jgi:hypothetical protein
MEPKAGDDRRVIPFRPRLRFTPRYEIGLLGDDWSSVHLPWLRLAVVIVGKDDESLEAAIAKLASADEDVDTLAAMFNFWREAKRDLDDVRDTLDIALNRCLDAVERTGRDLDDFPQV